MLCVNITKMVEVSSITGWDEHWMFCETQLKQLLIATESRKCVEADLESEENCCRSEERVSVANATNR